MSLLPTKKPSGGLLGRVRSSGLFGGSRKPNPLMYAGLGMLSQGPSLTPQSPFGGLGQGLAMYQQAMQGYWDNELAQAELDMRREELGMKRSAVEAKAAEAEAAKRAESEALMGQFDYLVNNLDVDPASADALIRSGRSGSYIEQHTKPVDVFTPPEMMDTPDGPQLMQRNTRTGRLQPVGGAGVRVDVDTGGEAAYDPKTTTGKIAADLDYWRSQPDDNPLKADMVASLTADLAKSRRLTGEQEERAGKYGTAMDAAKRFNELASRAEGAVGPIEGRITREKSELGIGSTDETELFSLESTMRAMMGTALSGAAIPPTEWPTYMAMIPNLADSPEARAGKMKALEGTMEYLEQRRREQMGQSAPPGALAGAVGDTSTDALIDALSPLDALP